MFQISKLIFIRPAAKPVRQIGVLVLSNAVLPQYSSALCRIQRFRYFQLLSTQYYAVHLLVLVPIVLVLVVLGGPVLPSEIKGPRRFRQELRS